MSSQGIRHPSKNAGIFAINPQKKRVREILRGLAGHRNLTIVESVRLDLRTAPLLENDIQSALNSAGRCPKTGFLQAGKRLFLKWQYNWCYRRLSRESPQIVACWNGLKGHRFLALSAAQRCGHQVLYLEEAPLPGRVTVDFVGINYGGSLPRRSDFYQRWLESNPQVDPTAWRSTKSQLRTRKTKRRKDTGDEARHPPLSNEKYIFCPLQVPGDSQITVYGDWLSSVEEMIDHLVKAVSALPDGWHLRVKEHPSARASFSAWLAGLVDRRIILDNSTDTMELVATSEAVVTINSTVGFESFFFDKPVIVLGHAFYAFDNLATKIRSSSDLVDLFANPDKLTFDVSARNAFVSYITEQHFPLEHDIIARHFTLDDIVARDNARNQLLLQLDGG